MNIPEGKKFVFEKEEQFHQVKSFFLKKPRMYVNVNEGSIQHIYEFNPKHIEFSTPD